MTFGWISVLVMYILVNASCLESVDVSCMEKCSIKIPFCTQVESEYCCEILPKSCVEFSIYSFCKNLLLIVIWNVARPFHKGIPKTDAKKLWLTFSFCTNMQYLKLTMDQYERDLLSVINSLLLSIRESDLQHTMSSSCNDSCIRFSLVKLLRLSGYDAGVCAAKWPGSSKVPGGDHEYIDVVIHNDAGSPERLIIDIDFHSHFQIARAVESYDRILASLPVVYVGSWNKMKQFLQVMVEAARASLKQNSMPFPPWRSVAYLQAKWQSPYQRKHGPSEQSFSGTSSFEHRQCGGHLKRLQSEIEIVQLLKPINVSRR